MALVKKKKLFFDVSMAISVTVGVVSQLTRICTQFTNGTPGDRYGALLQDFAPLTATSLDPIKRSRSVSAWFQCTTETQVSDDAGIVGAVISQLDFTGAANADSHTHLPNPSNVNFTGQDPIYTRHFRVRLIASKAVTDAQSIGLRGVIYVQRQHSIEV